MRPRLLLVEDDQTHRDLFLEAIHQLEDIEVSVAQSGQDAVRQLKELELGGARTAPAVVFLDLSMPGLTGFDVLRELRDIAAARRTPVVVFTASDRDVDVYLTYRLGANAFVVKPGDPEGFKQVVTLAAQFWLHTNVLPPT